MISVTELRNSTVFEDQGQIYQVVSYKHIKMGRGSANIKVKVRNIKTRAITQKSFINGAKVNDLRIIKKELQFLYKDNQDVFFMDPVGFEQFTIPLKELNGIEYLKNGNTYAVSYLKEQVLELNLPSMIELKVVEAGPSLRGNSAVNIYKDAVLENGIKVKVPLFIKAGDVVKIDTRNATYREKI